VSFALLFRLIEIQFARTLGLALSRVLIALQIGVRGHVIRHLSTWRRRRPLTKWVPGLRLELACNVLLSSPAAPPMRVAALCRIRLETVAFVLTMVCHSTLLVA
jgi:hypothetical protein